jgi:hypothetical protein
MKRLFLIFIIYFISYGDEIDFITQYEYGELLYKNPRGISCIKCHGEKATGHTIATFTHIKNDIKYKCSIKGPDITHFSLDKFIKLLNPTLKKEKKKFTKKQVCEKLTYGNSMPIYYLTHKEKRAIYTYISNVRDTQ